ncbi:MAG: glycosyltransferase [Thiolinea sp.]
MLRILEVCTASSPAYALVFARAQQLNQKLAGRVKIDLLCSDGDEVVRMRAEGMRVITTDLHRSLNPLRLLQSAWNLYRVLRQEKHDVIHLHFGVPSLVGRLLALFLRKPRWIYQSHGYSIADNTSLPGKTLYLLLERLLKHTVDIALFQSQEDMQLARRYQLLQERQMVYLGNGIDTRRFCPPDAEIPASPWQQTGKRPAYNHLWHGGAL